MPVKRKRARRLVEPLAPSPDAPDTPDVPAPRSHGKVDMHVEPGMVVLYMDRQALTELARQLLATRDVSAETTAFRIVLTQHAGGIGLQIASDDGTDVVN